jgi:hypothetical protein
MAYTAAIEADVSPERLQRFFIKENNKYLVRKEIREMVTFAQQNVVMDPPLTKLDRGNLSQNPNPTLHCPYGTPQPELRLLETTKRSGR